MDVRYIPLAPENEPPPPQLDSDTLMQNNIPDLPGADSGRITVTGDYSAGHQGLITDSPSGHVHSIYSRRFVQPHEPFSGSELDEGESTADYLIPGDLWFQTDPSTDDTQTDLKAWFGKRWVNINGVPTGSVQAFFGATAPFGWLLCYGQGIDKNLYPGLWEMFQYTYGGAGDTFNLPDLRGLALAGADNMGGAASGRLPGVSLNSTTGSSQNQLSSGHLPAHTHTATGSTVATGAHTHALNRNQTLLSVYTDPGGSTASPYQRKNWLVRDDTTQQTSDMTTAAPGHHSHTVSVSVSGGGNGLSQGNSFGIVQPTVGVNWMVRT